MQNVRFIPVILILWLTLFIRVFGEVPSVVVTYPDRSTETFAYLGENKSYLIVEIYGQPVSLAWSNIASAQINSADEPVNVSTATRSKLAAGPALMDFVTNIRVLVQSRWWLIVASIAVIVIGWRLRNTIQFHRPGRLWHSFKNLLPGVRAGKLTAVPAQAGDGLARDKADQMLKENRFGTAAEILEQELRTRPDSFELWLRYAEVHGFYCGDVLRAERIIQQMEQLRAFSDEQMQQALVKLRQWREKHPLRFRVH